MTIAVGLDFGTTNSCVSYVKNTSVEVIRNHNGEYMTCSCIGWQETLPIIGDIDKSVISNFKRLIGIADLSDELRDFYQKKGFNINVHSKTIYVEHNNTRYNINDLVSQYISELLKICSDNIGEKITDVVITVPVKFSSLQRQCLIDACVNSGINVLRVLNEPTAAALAYGKERIHGKKCETVLVFDCGGGTTDMSVIEMDYDETIYDIKYTYGFPFLGGEDITKNMFSYVIDKYNLDFDSSKKIRLLQKECERVKKDLSYKLNSTFLLESFLSSGDDLVFQLSRIQLENINRELFCSIEKELVFINKIYDIDKIVLVGGSSRIPYFKNLFQRIFGNNVLICDKLNPDHTVSIGAAIQAKQLQSQDNQQEQEFTLFDVINMSLGVEINDGIMCHIVSKNTTIPVSRTHIFTNSESYTDSISIKVYQGERKLCKYNTFLTEITLHNLDKTQRKGGMKIQVTFSIDVDGIVHITAVDLKTQQSILVSLDNNLFGQSGDSEDDFLFDDTILTNKISTKNEICDTLKNILTMLHSNDFSHLRQSQRYFLNRVFRRVTCFLIFYEIHTVETLIKVKSELETEFHNILLWNVESCSNIVGKSVIN